jgi:hypothetical protein
MSLQENNEELTLEEIISEFEFLHNKKEIEDKISFF